MWHAETSPVRKCKHLRSLRQRLMAAEEPLSVEGCRQFGKVPSTGSLCEFAWDAGEENVLRLLPRVEQCLSLRDKRDCHYKVLIEIANRSLTASLNFCLHPMYCSVVCTDAWPRRN